MPRTGMEPIRRKAIIEAAISTIGERGNLDVTVGQIARSAGVSAALAHHYFGGKDQIFLAAMRRILSDFAAEVRAGLRDAPQEKRAAAIVRACFAPSCFAPDVISAWMTFYVLAQTNTEAFRLWRVYQQRLKSNLTHALRGPTRDPEQAARTMVALIDGLYIRAALSDPETPERATVHALDVLAMLTEAGR